MTLKTNASTTPVGVDVFTVACGGQSNTGTLTVNKANQATLTVTGVPGTAQVLNATFTVGSSGGSGGGAVSYNASGACSNSGTLVTMNSGTGTCSVTATKATDTNYNSATSAAATVAAAKANQATLSAIATPASIVYNATSAMSTSGGTGTGTVSYAVTAGSSYCSVTGTTLTGIGVGTCTVTATKAADSNYNAATATVNVTVGKASQATLTVTGPASVTYGSTGSLTNSGGSGTGLVTYSAGASTGCSVAGSTLSVSNASGTCAVTATKAADNNYNVSATSTSFPVTLNKASQTVTFAPSTPVTFGVSPITLSATASSGLTPVTFFTSSSASICTLSGTNNSILTVTGTGTCALTATQLGNTNYTSASTNANVVINQASQNIAFGTAPTVVVGGTGTVNATGGASGNPVTFTSTTTGVCTVSGINGSTVTGVTAGSCTIAANQAGNANYNAATQVTQSFSVGSGSPPPGSCVPVPTTVDVNGVATAAPVIAGTGKLTVGNNSYIQADGAPLYTQGNGTSMTTTYGVGPPGQTLPPFSPTTFPSVGGANASVNNSTLAAGSYGTVSVSGSSSFSGGSYYISQLTAGNGVTLTMAAGDYFVDTWNVGNNFVLNVSSGPVRIFINRTFDAGQQSIFNTQGSTANFQIFAYNGAKLLFGNNNNSNNDIEFNGLIYAPGSNTEVNFGNSRVIKGSILSGGIIDLGNNTGVIFDSATQAAIGSISLNGVACTARFTVAKSFTPTSVAPNAASVLTITLVNTTAIPVTGVAFTDTYPSGLVNTTSPSAPSTCGGTVTAANNGNSVALSGGTVPANGSCTVNVNVTSATAGSYTNSTGPIHTNNGGTGAAASATLTVGAVAPGAFNAFETSTAAGAINGRIYTKIAGTAFSLDVVAISGGAQASSFTDSVKVELLANTGTPGSGYGSDNCPTSNSAIQMIASTSITGGRSSVSFTAVADVYRDVRVRISYPASSPTVIICSTDSFAIRPSTITLIAQDADAQTAGTTRTLNVVDANGAPTHKAGRPFKFLATAYNAAAMSTSNYAGSPTMTLSACSGTACTSGFGTFTPGATSFAAGTLSSSVASYSEVGAFNLTLQDKDFALVDAADTAASCAGYWVCSAPTPIGRFVPDHFETTVSPACGSGSGSFTYGGTSTPTPARPGQPFTAQVTAKNSASGTTVNYAGALAKTVTLSDGNVLGVGSLAPTTLAASAFAAGVAAPTLTYIFTSVTTPPVTIALRSVDTDAVTSSGYAEGSAEIRSGRAHMFNAYGSELLDLPVLFRTEYWAGTGWQLNSADICTNSNLVFTPVGTPDITGNTCVLEPGNNSGQGCAVALTPTQTNRRYLETGVIGTDSNGVAGFAGNFNLWLRAPGASVQGSIDITATVDSWLQYPWPKPANPANLMPWGRATFGIYKSPLIYRRENY